jgi:superfamily II DNA or RNA helicase
MLVIVPNTTLVLQMRNDWEEYDNGKMGIKIRQIYGGSKDTEDDKDIVVGTFQSLTKKQLDFFKGMNVVFVDEAHQTKTTSIKDILSKCKDSIYRFGLS